MYIDLNEKSPKINPDSPIITSNQKIKNHLKTLNNDDVVLMIPYFKNGNLIYNVVFGILVNGKFTNSFIFRFNPLSHNVKTDNLNHPDEYDENMAVIEQELEFMYSEPTYEIQIDPHNKNVGIVQYEPCIIIYLVLSENSHIREIK